MSGTAPACHNGPGSSAAGRDSARTHACLTGDALRSKAVEVTFYVKVVTNRQRVGDGARVRFFGLRAHRTHAIGLISLRMPGALPLRRPRTPVPIRHVSLSC
jgi:hypothetical protein